MVSRVETEDRYVISKETKICNKDSDDLRLQTAAKRLRVQIRHSDMWDPDVFYYKTCYNRFVYF